MDSTLALAITKVFLEEMDKANAAATVVEEATAKTTKHVTKRKAVTIKKQEKKSDGNNSNC